VNWTEILEKGGVPDSPGYQELLQQIKEEQALRIVVDDGRVLLQRKHKRRRGKG
jgi:hypothetical protein